MTKQTHSQYRIKPGSGIVAPISLVLCFGSITAFLIEFDGLNQRHIFEWLLLLQEQSLKAFWINANHDVSWFMFAIVTLLYGILGIGWLFYNTNTQMTDKQVSSTDGDIGFMLVYVSFPLLVIFLGLAIYVWADNAHIKAWLQLVVEKDSIGQKLFGVFACALTVVGYSILTFLLISMIVKGCVAMLKHTDLGPMVLTLNQTSFNENDFVIGRFDPLGKVVSIKNVTLQCSRKYCPPNGRAIRFELLFRDTVNAEIIEGENAKEIEVSFKLPSGIMADSDKYKHYLINAYVWLITAEIELEKPLRKRRPFTRNWIINVEPVSKA